MKECCKQARRDALEEAIKEIILLMPRYEVKSKEVEAIIESIKIIRALINGGKESK